MRSEPVRPQSARVGALTLDAPFGVFRGPARVIDTGAVDRMETAVTLAERDANTLNATLLPGLVAARDALDPALVGELGGAAIGLFARMRGARDAAVELDRRVPKACTPGSAISSSPEDNHDLPARLAALQPIVDGTVVRTLVTFVPHELRGVSIAGVAPNPDLRQGPELLQAHLENDLERTVRMLALVAELRRDIYDTPDGLTKRSLDRAADKVALWGSRPIDLAFLKAALGDLWGLINNGTTTTGRLDTALANASEQAQERGWFFNAGQFDIHAVPVLLAMGGAETVRQVILTADRDVRARLLDEMWRAGLLGPFCKQLGPEAIKELHDSLGFGSPDLKTALQSQFLGFRAGYGPSLGEEWERHETSISHFLGEVPYVGCVLNTAFGFATWGFGPEYSKLHDDYYSGKITSAEYVDGTTHLLERTAAVAVVSTLTGGAADKFIRGGEAAAFSLRAIGAGAASGAASSVAGKATGEAFNVYVSGEQEQFSSIEDYFKTALIGAGVGAGMAGGTAAINSLSGRARAFLGRFLNRSSNSSQETGGAPATNQSSNAPVEEEKPLLYRRVDLVPSIEETSEQWGFTMRVRLPNGASHRVIEGSVPVESGEALEGPKFRLETRAKIGGQMHKVTIVDEAGNPVSVTDIALDETLAAFRERFGYEPEELGGLLAEKNLRNFQNEYVTAIDAGSSPEDALQKAAASISFGRSRIARGYSHLEVETFGHETMDHGDPPQTCTVPQNVIIHARRR